jgi:hypothetical protein
MLLLPCTINSSPSAMSSPDVYQQLLAVPKFVDAFDSIELAFLQVALQDDWQQRPTVQQLLAADPYMKHGPVRVVNAAAVSEEPAAATPAAAAAEGQPSIPQKAVDAVDAARDSKDSLTWAAVGEMLREFGY